MKTCILAAFFTVALMGGAAWSRPVDLSAPTGLGATNQRGYLEIWREIADAGINFGKGSYLPLRYKFSTEDDAIGMLGSGFYCPIFQANNVLLREMMMRAYLPCGKALYLRRDNTDPNKFQTLDQVWTGTLSGDDFTITRDDGWTIFYHKGHLTSITTDEKAVFNWSYEPGRGASVSKAGQTVISVEETAAGQASAFVFEGKRYELEYAERPLTQILLGQTAIKQLAPALASFKYPDGKEEKFEFSLTPDRIPTLTFTDQDQKQTVYTWDVATNFIASESGSAGDSTYKIDQSKESFALPKITRIASDGRSESMAIDQKLGITTEKALDGEVTVRTTFTTPGPLYGKLREVTDTSDGARVVLQFGYDELGRLIRKIDTNGFTTLLSYGPDGKVSKSEVLAPSDPSILKVLQAREKVLMALTSDAKTSTEKEDCLSQLSLFYIYKVGDINKALSLAEEMTNSSDICDIQMHAVLGNQNLTSAQKAAHLQQLLSAFPNQKDALTEKITFYLSQTN